MPQRIQRRRVKGWRMPEGAVYVGRGSKWGNPFRVYQCRCCPVRRWDIIDENGITYVADHSWRGKLSGLTQQLEREYCERAAVTLFADIVALTLDLESLRGRDLACWCPLDQQPCHADVLLELANPGWTP